jgi:hypothetical protein
VKTGLFESKFHEESESAREKGVQLHLREENDNTTGAGGSD